MQSPRTHTCTHARTHAHMHALALQLPQLPCSTKLSLMHAPHGQLELLLGVAVPQAGGVHQRLRIALVAGACGAQQLVVCLQALQL